MQILKNKIKSIIPNILLIFSYILKVLSDKFAMGALKIHMLFKTDIGKAAIEAEKAMKDLIKKMKEQHEMEQTKRSNAINNSQNIFVLNPNKKQKD